MRHTTQYQSSDGYVDQIKSKQGLLGNLTLSRTCLLFESDAGQAAQANSCCLSMYTCTYFGWIVSSALSKSSKFLQRPTGE